MRLMSWRSLRVLIVCGACVVGPALDTSVPVAASSSCEALHAWAQHYDPSRVNLDTFAALERPYRRALFGAIPPDMRANLQREHLTQLKARTDFSPAQRALIEEAIELATPALYRGEPTATRAAESLSQRVAMAFITPAHRQAWGDLGSVAAGTARPSSAAGYCECRAFTVWECPDCERGSCSSITACGPMHNQTCNGMCMWPSPAEAKT